MIRRFSFCPVFGEMDSSLLTSSDFLIPSGVSSNAQATIRTIGKPAATRIMVAVSNQPGSASGSLTATTIWIISHPTIA